MKKYLFLTGVLLAVTSTTSAQAYNGVVQVSKVEFDKENFNPYNYPRSLAVLKEKQWQQAQAVEQATQQPAPQQPVFQQVVAQEPAVQKPVIQEIRRPVAQQPQQQFVQYQESEPKIMAEPQVQTPTYRGDEYLQPDERKYEVSAKVGSQGIGADLSYKVNDYLATRIGGNYLEYSDSERIGDINYDYDAKAFNANALLDIHPFKNGFRLTGGAYYNPDEIDISARPTSNVTIGNATYTPSQIGTLNSTVETGDFSPYAGVGYSSGFANDSDWSFNADLGAKFNDVSTTLTSTGGGVSATDLNNEKRKLDKRFDILEIYPILSLGVGYKF